jgi:hypothetical protein
MLHVYLVNEDNETMVHLLDFVFYVHKFYPMALP